MGVITQRFARVFYGLDADKANIPASSLAAGDLYIATNSGYFYQYNGGGWEWPIPGQSIIEAKIHDLAVTEGKIGALAVTAAKLAADAVETAKIKDLNVTATKLAADAVETAKIKDGAVTAPKLGVGLGQYIPRLVGAPDFVGGNPTGAGVDFTTNANFQANGLDLTGIVPVGAVAVALRIRMSVTNAFREFLIRRDAVNDENRIWSYLNVANGFDTALGIVALDSDRLMDYYGSNDTFATLEVTVVGWVI